MKTRSVTTSVGFTLFVALMSMSAHGSTFFVDSTADAVDENPGDGICSTVDEECTLRAAVMQSNASEGADIIDMTAINDPASPIILTIDGVDEVIGPREPGEPAECTADIEANASIGDLDITGDLEIIGAGPGLTVVQWDEQSLVDPNVGDRIFHVQALPDTTVNLVRISDLMVMGGSVGIPNSLDPDNEYNCGDVMGEPGSQSVWQFRRFGGAIAVGPGAAVVLFEETVHGPGGGGGGEGPPPDVGPGGEEGEGGVTAVEFERIAVIGNQAGSDAGGIIAAAEMTIVDSVLSGNLSNGNGGALYLDSTTTITGTLIGTSSTDVPYESGAVAAALLALPNVGENGGGIFDTGSHTTNIEASAINGNTAIGGGGIAARSLVVVNLTNATVSGNTGSDVGGGITTNGTVNLRNVTVADNTATTDAPGGGAGLNSFGSGTYVFFNTILSNNIVQGGGGGRAANCGCSGGLAACGPGRMVSTGYNISDEATDTCSLQVVLNDQPDTDPLLQPLASNGGLTETHALPSEAIGDPATSPAIDMADNLRCPNNDQRGSLRPDDGDLDGSFGCDVGAFELFIVRTDLHINNVTAPNTVDKGATFIAEVEIHNDDGNVAAPGVVLDATLNTLTGMSIIGAVPSTGSCEIVSSDVLTCSIGNMEVGAIETVAIELSANEQGAWSMISTIETTDGPVDPVPGNNTVTTNVFVLGNSDIALSADPVPATMDLGDSLILDLVVINNGPDDATGSRLGMVIPAGMSFVSATPSKGNCASAAGEILCTFGGLDLAESVTVQIRFVADAVGDVNLAVVAIADQNDPDDTNNAFTATVTVIPNADLSLSAASAAPSVNVGGRFTVTVTVANAGPQAATNVVGTATLPGILSFVSSATGCTANGAVVTCTTPSIAAGANTTFALLVNADSAGSATVSATVVADENDPNPANNNGSVTVTVATPTPPPSGGGGGGGGGCVYDPSGPMDPTLPLILLGSLLALWRRRLVTA